MLATNKNNQAACNILRADRLVGATEITVFRGSYHRGGKTTGQVICKIKR